MSPGPRAARPSARHAALVPPNDGKQVARSRVTTAASAEGWIDISRAAETTNWNTGRNLALPRPNRPIPRPPGTINNNIHKGRSNYGLMGAAHGLGLPKPAQAIPNYIGTQHSISRAYLAATSRYPLRLCRRPTAVKNARLWTGGCAWSGSSGELGCSLLLFFSFL